MTGEPQTAGDLAPTTRVAAYAVVVDGNGRILLVRIAPGYSAVGQWTLPGGGLDFGERPELGVIRELKEETGLTGEVERLAFVASWSRGAMPEQGWGPFHAIQIAYLVRITGGELRHEIDESTDMAAWFGLDDLQTVPIVELVGEAIAYLSKATDADADRH